MAGTKTALFVRKVPGGVYSVEDQAASTGDRWFVHAGSGTDGAGYGTHPDSPVATLDYAVGLATANQGDIIYCMPGHAENLDADSAVDIDVAGLTVIGLGHGADRPTFTATATAGDFKLAAASTRIENLLFVGGIDATTGIIEVSAADCEIIDCEYQDSTGQATDVMMVTAGSHRLLVDGWRHIGAAGDGGDTSIAVVDSDDITITNFNIYGNFDLGAIQFRTTASARAHIHTGRIWTEGSEDLAIKDLVTGCTGIIGPDIMIMLKDNAANITEAITGATFVVMDPVYVCNLAGEKAMLINWTASTDA